MKTIIIDNFLSKVECDNLINYYKENEKFSKQWYSRYPLSCNLKDIKLKLNVISKQHGAEVDWFDIVKWPVGSEQNLHFDDAKKDTVLSSITYLNDNFKGGQTYFEEGTIFKPKVGRSLFFDGQYYRHGVKPVEENIRYVVAAWYKKLNPIS